LRRNQYFVAAIIRHPEHVTGILTIQIPQQLGKFAAEPINRKQTRYIPSVPLNRQKSRERHDNIVIVHPLDTAGLCPIGYAENDRFGCATRQRHDQNFLFATHAEYPGDMIAIWRQLSALDKWQAGKCRHAWRRGWRGCRDWRRRLGKCRSRQQQCSEQKATNHAFSPKVFLHIFNTFPEKRKKITVTSQSLRAFIFEPPATTSVTRFMAAFDRR
jgi:hypothetical protein